MLNRARVLIAEDESVTAMDMACAVEDAGGKVVGPVARVSDGLELIEREQIDAAILDVVVLFHTASDAPPAISGHAAVCKKPTHVDEVLRVLAERLNRRS
jgi:AmiR/NasT family two-component response regulator